MSVENIQKQRRNTENLIDGAFSHQHKNKKNEKTQQRKLKVVSEIKTEKSFRSFIVEMYVVEANDVILVDAFSRERPHKAFSWIAHTACYPNYSRRVRGVKTLRVLRANVRFLLSSTVNSPRVLFFNYSQHACYIRI